MAKKCIICGMDAGSNEHVFPAALGGRRTNRGIYCGPHNEGFSDHAKLLADTLRLFNARLSIRPDHDDEATRIEVTGADGAVLSMSGDLVALAKPQIVGDTTANGIRNLELRFGSMKQAQDWVASQRALGHEVNLGTPVVQRVLSPEVPYIQVGLGGDDFFRALTYVAMTFFAQAFPETTRNGGIKQALEYALGDQGSMVWWESVESFSDTPPNPFPFGHTVAVANSKERQRAQARISLFSTLNFSLDLGEVLNVTDDCVVVHIDPTAETARNSTITIKQDNFCFQTKPSGGLA